MRSDLGPAVADVVKAIVVKGPAPWEHDRTHATLRRIWPTLADALDRLVVAVLAKPERQYLDLDKMATAIVHGAYYDGLEAQAITKDDALEFAGLIAGMVLNGELVPAEALGREMLRSLGEAKIKFWHCPDPDHHFVEWDGDLATCTTCGKNNGR